MKFTVGLVLGFVIAGSGAFADEIADLIQAKCLKCHNDTPDEFDSTHFPTLGAQTSEYLFQSMKAYVTKDRSSDWAVAMMTKRVNKYDDTTLRAIADYYSKTPAPKPAAGDPALIAAGKEIYEKGIKAKKVTACSACHGDAAEGDEENARLAGQFSWFLIDQMVGYKSGAIKNQTAMTKIANAMTDEEVAAVSVYLQSVE